METTALTATATRTWNADHTKATVTVTWSDGTSFSTSGKAAARCEYVIIVHRPAGTFTNRHSGQVLPVEAMTWCEGLRSKPMDSVRGNPADSVRITEA